MKYKAKSVEDVIQKLETQYSEKKKAFQVSYYGGYTRMEDELKTLYIKIGSIELYYSSNLLIGIYVATKHLVLREINFIDQKLDKLPFFFSI